MGSEKCWCARDLPGVCWPCLELLNPLYSKLTLEVLWNGRRYPKDLWKEVEAGT